MSYILKFILIIFISIITISYLHEYHITTLTEYSKIFPYWNTILGGIHSILSLCDQSVKSMPTQSKDTSLKKDKLFTIDDLKKYTVPEKGLYLAILGKVYDVSKGRKYYGEGGSYHFFTGRDGSRAFVTGDFTEAGLTDNILDLTSQDLRGLSDWAAFYHKDYKYKGKLIGRYYDSEGRPTKYQLEVTRLIEKAKDAQADADKEKLLLPPCNMEWSKESGSRVWCTKMSGGIERDWVGVPRQYFEPGLDTFRCACVNTDDNILSKQGSLREYPECHSKATSCNVNT